MKIEIKITSSDFTEDTNLTLVEYELQQLARAIKAIAIPQEVPNEKNNPHNNPSLSD